MFQNKYLFIYYESRTKVHMKNKNYAIMTHTQVMNNKIHVCNTQR